MIDELASSLVHRCFHSYIDLYSGIRQDWHESGSPSSVVWLFDAFCDMFLTHGHSGLALRSRFLVFSPQWGTMLLFSIWRYDLMSFRWSIGSFVGGA